MRKCAWRKCKTILNKWNGNPCCSVHQSAYIDSMDQRIQDCEIEICSLQNFVRKACEVSKMEQCILMKKDKIKRLIKLRDRKYPCAEIVEIAESIYTQKADIPVGF